MLNDVKNFLSYVGKTVWFRLKNLAHRVWVYAKTPKYHYLYCGKYVWRVPMEFTPSRVMFYMEMRTRDSNTGWPQVQNPFQDVEQTMRQLGFVPYITVEPIHPGV